MSKLVEVTPENLEEIKNRIKDFVNQGSFLQTHDWLYSPRCEFKKYNELTFKFADIFYCSGVVSLHGYTIQLTNPHFVCECCDETCDGILTLAYIGDEIEFGANYINVVSHGYGKNPKDDASKNTIIVWRLYRKENK